MVLTIGAEDSEDGSLNDKNDLKSINDLLNKAIEYKQLRYCQTCDMNEQSKQDTEQLKTVSTQEKTENETTIQSKDTKSEMKDGSRQKSDIEDLLKTTESASNNDSKAIGKEDVPSTSSHVESSENEQSTSKSKKNKATLNVEHDVTMKFAVLPRALIFYVSRPTVGGAKNSNPIRVCETLGLSKHIMEHKDFKMFEHIEEDKLEALLLRGKIFRNYKRM